MKKLFATLLALAMVLSMSVCAFAEQDLSQYLDNGTTFTKEYVVNNGTAPAEDFEFEVAYQSYKNNEGESADATSYPTVTLGKASFEASAETKTATADVTITDYENVALGVYTYAISEKAGTTAGVTYNSDPVYLVVTILRDEESANHYVAAIHYETATGEKTGEITNSYNAGQLTVTKQIEGNMADMTKKFEFTVVFTPAAGTKFDTTVQIADDAASTNREYTTATANEDGTYTIMFELGDGETATFTNIPVGTTYTVSENEDGYTKEHTTVADGSITGGDTDADVWTNTLTKEVDTGISLDSMPYILMLAVAVIGCVALVGKKRVD